MKGGYLGDPEITGEHEIDVGLGIRRSLREPFLKGPLALRDLALVAQMPGKALALWLLIRYRSDVSRDRWVTVPRRLLADWGVGKDAKIDAMRRLEHAGLIAVDRPKGYMAKIRIVRKRKQQ